MKRDLGEILWIVAWLLLCATIFPGLPGAVVLIDRNACLSIPGNTWTFPGGCHWPPLDLGAHSTPTSSKGGA